MGVVVIIKQYGRTTSKLLATVLLYLEVKGQMRLFLQVLGYKRRVKEQYRSKKSENEQKNGFNLCMDVRMLTAELHFHYSQ